MMQVHEMNLRANKENFTPGGGTNERQWGTAHTRFVQGRTGRPLLATCLFKSGNRDQITGFQAMGTSRYLGPSFSTWPIEGNVKWKPTTIAFSADAMS
jgi:hypothetical protein